MYKIFTFRVFTVSTPVIYSHSKVVDRLLSALYDLSRGVIGDIPSLMKFYRLVIFSVTQMIVAVFTMITMCDNLEVISVLCVCVTR